MTQRLECRSNSTSPPSFALPLPLRSSSGDLGWHLFACVVCQVEKARHSSHLGPLGPTGCCVRRRIYLARQQAGPDHNSSTFPAMVHSTAPHNNTTLSPHPAPCLCSDSA